MENEKTKSLLGKGENVQREILARPEGLEPPTCRLEGGCSIQLSYGREAKGPKQTRN